MGIMWRKQITENAMIFILHMRLEHSTCTITRQREVNGASGTLMGIKFLMNLFHRSTRISLTLLLIARSTLISSLMNLSCLVWEFTDLQCWHHGSLKNPETLNSKLTWLFFILQSLTMSNHFECSQNPTLYLPIIWLEKTGELTI